VLDCKASLKCFEIQTSSPQQIGISPEQIPSKQFKKFHIFQIACKSPENGATLQGSADRSALQQNDTQCWPVALQIFKNIQPISVGV
jgi:hypothetical protein